MSNMSYCRFENTYRDLSDCLGALDSDGVDGIEEEASDYEKPYIRKLIELCKDIAECYEHELND